MEHLEHFKLSMDPFRNDSDLSFFYESQFHADAYARLKRSVDQGKGLTLLMGEHGVGKSLLVRRIFESLDEDKFEAVLMVMLRGTANSQTVLSRLARDLGAETLEEGRAEVLTAIYLELIRIREEGRSLVLMIDDAEVLGTEVMSEIGGLLNMEHEGRGLLSIVLVGSSEIDTCVGQDPGLAERVDVRICLKNLDLDAVKGYLNHRLSVVAGPRDLLSDSVVHILAKTSDGRPRVINNLVDNAMFEAYLRGASQVGSEDVERAAGDLGLIPRAQKGDPLPELGPKALESSSPSSDAARDAAHPIAKLGLVEGQVPFMADLEVKSIDSPSTPSVVSNEDLVVLGAPEEEVWSLDEGILESPLAHDLSPAHLESDHDVTMDLEVEWLPDSASDELDLASPQELEADDLAATQSFSSEDFVTQKARGRAGLSSPATMPIEAEDAFLDLLDD